MGHFMLIDYVIFLATLTISVLIGVYFGFAKGGQQSTKEFLLGDRRMPVIPTALSLMVSFQSGILILGFSSEMYMKGTNIIFHAVGVVIALPLAAWIYQPIFYKLQLTSAYEYLELRYNSVLVRKIGSLLFMLTTLLYMSIAMYAPAIALCAVSGLSVEFLVVATGLACTFYTALGGLKAVVWTDAFQAVVMYVGFLLIIIEGIRKVGGIDKVWSIGVDGGRIRADLNPNPFVYMSVWTVMLGTAFGWVSIYGTNQTAVQRYTSLSSLRKARLSLLLVIPGVLLMIPMVCFTGVLMYAYYAHCDPLDLKLISNRDQLLPYFTVEVLSSIHGLPGIFLASLYSGTLSTVSSGLNSIAAVVWEDFLKPKFEHRISDQRATQVTKLTAFLFGILAISLALVAQHLGGVLQAAMTVINVFGGPLSGMFLFGMLFPWANKQGALAGVAVSVGIVGWICTGAQIIKPYQQSLPRSTAGCTNSSLFPGADTFNETMLVGLLNSTALPLEDVQLSGISYVYKLSYKLYGVVGILLVFLVGAPVSLITSRLQIDTTLTDLMWPQLTTICCCLLPRQFKQSMQSNHVKSRVKVIVSPRKKMVNRDRGERIRSLLCEQGLKESGCEQPMLYKLEAHRKSLESILA
uniref:Sodium-dependent multivitamin transporter n=1 Tax=Plectus sambesii TaxID=2011161 RepID=A0A914VIV3_9BILA